MLAVIKVRWKKRVGIAQTYWRVCFFVCI